MRLGGCQEPSTVLHHVEFAASHGLLPTPRRYLHGDPGKVIAFAMACGCASCDKCSGAVEGPQHQPPWSLERQGKAPVVARAPWGLPYSAPVQAQASSQLLRGILDGCASVHVLVHLAAQLVFSSEMIASHRFTKSDHFSAERAFAAPVLAISALSRRAVAR
jgi:hypothetical protein